MQFEKFRSQLTGEPIIWATQGWGVLGVGAAGTLSGAIVFEGSNDNETWTPLQDLGSGAMQVTAEGQYRFDIAGFEKVKISPTDGTTVDMWLDGLGVA